MPRQNRVTPFGEIVAIPERGTFMGNRGVLHDVEGNVKRPWQVKRWLVCVLEFRGRKRQVMAPDRYTELFFLDEATALAAGHRPCSECRHARFLDFCNAWKAFHGGRRRPTADEMDNRLHTERVSADRSKRSYVVTLRDLPEGVLVTVSESPKQPYLLWSDALLPWHPCGYGPVRFLSKEQQVRVLTPRCTVEAIQAGYVPDVHASVRGHSMPAPDLHTLG